MKAYKGFSPQPDGTMKCRDKTYVEGETYTEPTAEPCVSGMHACLAPIDVLAYYPLASSVFHEVEVAGYSGAASATGYSGAASATGDSGAASATGYSGAASATGDSGAASATGDDSVAVAAGPNCRAMGAEGCVLFLIERDDNWHIIGHASVKVGATKHGIRIKPGAWYQLVGGRVVEAVQS